MKNILIPINEYYTQKIRLHGRTALGVDWKSPESQVLRFEQLTKMIDGSKRFTLSDFGCGYGLLCDFLQKKGFSFQYYGFDISAEMILQAKTCFSSNASAHFKVGNKASRKTDYAVASGIFNVRLKAKKELWKRYILDTLNEMNRCTKKGFSFNCLTLYSDKERMRRDLYYADSLFFFDYCKKHFSKNVALLHDYGLYEFTILIRKDI